MSLQAHTLLSKPAVSSQMRALVLVLFLFVFLGGFLHLIQGGRFVFFYASQYKQAGWVSFFFLLPLFAGLLFTHRRFTAHMQIRYPTRWVRRLFMYPLLIVIAAGAVVVAPLGWLAAGAWAFGTPQAPVPAKVTSIEQFRSRKGCDQHVTLSLLSTRATICLADHYAGSPLKADQNVIVSGKATLAGFLIGNFAGI